MKQDAQDQVIEACHGLTGPALGQACVIFAPCHIAAVVQAVRDAPVGADHFEQAVRRHCIPAWTGKTMFGLFLDFTGLMGNKAALQFEGLLQVRPSQIIFELAADRERP